MAIYHLSAKIVSRSKGQSIIACAAYRSAEKLHDERTDQSYDYTKKRDVAFGEILLPQNAPEWMLNREKLWNAVEHSEKRKDAQLAREVQVALPRELSLNQNIELTREFVNHCFVSKGMVADINIHMDKASDGELQPHAHILLTMREIKENSFGQKARIWNDKAELENSREQWANFTNKHLALNGYDIQIDHRTLVEQGIHLEPQKKIGATSAFHRMAAYTEHNQIAERNGKRLIVNPEIVLDILTKQQSTFTLHDIARIINRHTLNSDQFQAVFGKVKALPELASLGMDEKGQERFTTIGMIKLETELVSDAISLAQTANHSLKGFTEISSGNLSEQQRNVLEFITSDGDLKSVIGYAGTGKSRLLDEAKQLWEASGFRVLGATLSGIAAENLEASSGIVSRTIASRFYYWDRGQELLSSKDILVIDEAGMIGSRQMAALLNEANQRGAKVVLVGDPEQLQAIEAGAAFRAIIERTPYIELTEIWRQKAAWQKQATMDLATGNTQNALSIYATHDRIHEHTTQSDAMRALVDYWNDDRISNPDKSQIMLAYTRNSVFELNTLARCLKQSLGELGEDHRLLTERGDRDFAIGDRVYFLKNDRDLGVKNGTLGTIDSITEHVLKIKLDKDNTLHPQIVKFSIHDYNFLDYGYAATIHKGQGVTVDNSYILASKLMDKHATYVAMTRHSDNLELFWNKEDFSCYSELVKTLASARPKETTLDYTSAEFIQARNVDILKDIHHFSTDLPKGYQPPEEFEDLFTHDLKQKIINADKKDFSDLSLVSNKKVEFQEYDISKSKDEMEY